MKSDPASVLAPPAQIAKAALRRLAMDKLEPTPEHFARAYAQEAGLPPPAGEPAARPEPALDWAALIERLARALERGSKQWTGARKKQSLQRVLDGSRNDAARLHERLDRLVASWATDSPDGEVEPSAPMPLDEPAADAAAHAAPAGPSLPAAAQPSSDDRAAAWPGVAADLHATVQAALPESAREIADALAEAADRLALDGPTLDVVASVAALCERARRVLVHNRHLADELAALCRAMTDSLGELAEDESWARGQIETMRERLASGVTARGVRAAGDLLQATRERQREIKHEREQARDALKQLFQRMLGELGELGTHTGRFNDQVQRHAESIARADSLQGLTGVVQELLGETRAVQQVVSGARERLATEHARATQLEQRVRDLEGELRRLSDEVCTDALTQVANRRGLMQAFDAERQHRADGGAAQMAIGLIDIDNFKKLNDSLGHAAGDIALKALASRVKQWLRPADHVARFGGEEFVVLLPGMPADEAQALLTKLQRQLSASLFMHDGREVFVTFSAGVTAYRADGDGEPLDAALERADQALYEAKRTGKNRTCIG
ncbi:MAG: diguanylate cyclase [Burkholderiaceae bacterium]